MPKKKYKSATVTTNANRKQLAATQALSILKTPSGHDSGTKPSRPHPLRWTIPQEQRRY